ncbi:MAG TPA: FGGY-family carbohydrate kinase, partial [Candidatus Brocadiia bacterium]|nr:FGGY-family carbohydrate kinase [Candidatus Brocadiia bacterium]
LSGRCATDRALCPSTLYYDLVAADWWTDMLRALGVSPEQLPELKTSGEIAGFISDAAARDTGLSPATPVTTSPIDQIAAAVGAGNMTPGVVTACVGAALALCATLDRPAYDPLKRAGLYAHALPDRYVLMPWVPTAGMVLRWFRDAFGGGQDYASLIEEAAPVPPGCDGLTMLPHLCGAFGPAPDSHARGAFLGLTLAHGRGHMVRAILEAVAFMLRENIEMLDAIGVPVHEVRVLGGAARSDLWLRIMAEVCRRDLLVMDCEEAAGLGTAAIAFAAAGIFPSLAAAAKEMTRVRRRVALDASAAGYEAVYQRFQSLQKAARDLR